MAPTLSTPQFSGRSAIHRISRSISSKLSKHSIRDTMTLAQPLASLAAVFLTSRSSLSRRALTSIAELSSQRSSPNSEFQLLNKRQQSVILVIPTTYAGLNDGPSPGAVVGITLGSIGGVFLVLYIVLLTVQFYGNQSTTVVQEEVVVKKRSHKSKSRSRHSSHTPAPAAPPPRRETIVEIEEEIIRHSSRHSVSPSLSPDEVIVEEEATTVTEEEEIVEVIEEQSSIASPSPSRPPPSRKASSRRSGYRTVDPAEFAGGSAQIRRVSRRSSGR